MATPRVGERHVRCCECGADVIAGRAGMPPARCSPCRASRRRAWDEQRREAKSAQQREQRRRLAAERVWTPEMLMCSVCSVSFPRRKPKGPAPKRCPLCTAFVITVGVHARRGLMAGGEDFTAADIFERDDQRCHLCGGICDGQYPEPMSPSLDHLIPISRGGLHTRANVKTAHLLCNMVRGVRDAPLATTA